MIFKTLLSFVFAVVLADVGFRLANVPNILRVRPVATLAVTPTPTPAPSTHPLLFPHVSTNANVSIGFDQACVQILDGPRPNMWTYGGTLPGITIRRPPGQMTNVTFTHNLDPPAAHA